MAADASVDGYYDFVIRRFEHNTSLTPMPVITLAGIMKGLCKDHPFRKRNKNHPIIDMAATHPRAPGKSLIAFLLTTPWYVTDHPPSAYT